MADEQRRRHPVPFDPQMHCHRCFNVKLASFLICEVDQDKGGKRVKEGYLNSPPADTLRSLTLPPGSIPVSALFHIHMQLHIHISSLLKLFHSFPAPLPLPVLIYLLLYSSSFTSCSFSFSSCAPPSLPVPL